MDPRQRLPINNCGKIIVSQGESLDDQIDLLHERAIKNGVFTQIIDNKQINEIEPRARWHQEEVFGAQTHLSPIR